MRKSSRTVVSPNGLERITVEVEVEIADAFSVKWSETGSFAVSTTDGNSLEAKDIKIYCFSGARFARLEIQQRNIHVNLLNVFGQIERPHYVGISVATAVAVAAALDREQLLPPEKLEGWQVVTQSNG